MFKNIIFVYHIAVGVLTGHFLTIKKFYESFLNILLAK